MEVVLGNAEIDLTGAGLEGGRAVLAVSAVLGSIELRVRPDWRVVIEGAPFLGTIEQKRPAPDQGAAAGTLNLHASAVLGSITIR